MVVGLAAMTAAQPARAVTQTFTLGLEDTAFWSGPAPGPAECTDGTCWEYALDVKQAAERLRVGFDHATDGDVWNVDVSGPGGITQFTPGVGLYSQEGVIDSPTPGRYTVRVSTEEVVKDPRFRLRAKLEGPLRLPAGHVAILPNMQPLPPYEFTFQTPVSNGSLPSEEPVGLPLPGGRAACHPEEVAEQQAVRCLRMAFGVRNTGMGPMQLSYRGAEFPMDQELVQTVVYSDGVSEQRVAGVAKYHKTHQHYHHDQAIGLQLFKVADPVTGGLEEASAEHRKGFAHRNELLREWKHFYPLMGFDGFGLKAGWGDYYEWDRPGNYIDFGLNGDGRYVLRMTADPVDGILESNERDNMAYSLIEVAGEEIKWLQSGRGSDPWDPCRILVSEGAEPEPPDSAQPPRPSTCPPDTVWAELVPPSPAAPAPAVAPVAQPVVAPKPAAKRTAKQRAAARKRAALKRCLKRARRLRSRPARYRRARRACTRRRSGRDKVTLVKLRNGRPG
jgi:hypothetical protein